MGLNPRASKSGSANSSYEPGGIFQAKITLVYDDGTVRVFVRMLGISVGPCRVIGKEYNEQFVVNDEVLVAYLDNLKGEMVVIGRLTDRPGAEAATTEPIGHEDKTESTISFVNATRVFTIAPVGESFNVWCVGRRYTKTAAESITLPATTGLYYIYYSATGVLSYKTSYFTWDQDAPTAYVYYNSGTEEAEFFADERHGVTLDWATHEYLHRTRGASLAEGLGASGYTLAGTGSSNADMQISIENGTFFDEDLEVNITHSATPTANTWEQRLQSPAYIPMFYRFGSSGSWRLDTATAYPVKYGSARATYNLSSGGTWSTPDMTSGKFGVTWIVATNNLNEPVIGILGQTVSDNIGQAEDVSYADLDLTGLPIVEIRPLYKLIYETNTGYTNAVKSRLASIADIRANQAINIGIGAGALSSLTDVGLTTTATNDILAYNGSNWTNTNTPTFQSVTIIGGVTVDTSTFSVDAANNRVGIGTVSPSTALQVVGTVTATAFAGALTGNVIGNVTGNVTGNVSGTAATVTGAAQTSITSLGTLTSLSINGANSFSPSITLGDWNQNDQFTAIRSQYGYLLFGSTNGPNANIYLRTETASGTVIIGGGANNSVMTVGATDVTIAGSLALSASTNAYVSYANTPDSALPWMRGPTFQGQTGWAFYSSVSGSYRMGFRGNSAGTTRYMWSADSVLIGAQPADVEVTNTLNVMGTGRFTSTVTAPTFSGALSGNATSATTATNQSGGTVSASYVQVNTSSTSSAHASQGLQVLSSGTIAGLSFWPTLHGIAPVLRCWNGNGEGVDCGNNPGTGYAFLGASSFITRCSIEWKDDVRIKNDTEILDDVLATLSIPVVKFNDKYGEPIKVDDEWTYVPTSDLSQEHRSEPIQSNHFDREGFIAETVAQVFPKASTFNSEGKPNGTDMGVITAQLLDAVKLLVLQGEEFSRRLSLLEGS